MVEIVKFIVIAIMLSLTTFTIVSFIERHVELRVEKDKFKEYARAMNLLNVIIMSRDLTSKDSYGQPLKAMLEELMLDTFKDKELDCCNYYEYDYSLIVEDFRTKQKWHFGFPQDELKSLFDEGKRCGEIDKNKQILTLSLPVNIRNGDNINMGEIRIKMIETPLSKLTYSVLRACTYDNYKTSFYVYGLSKGESGISLEPAGSNKYRVCTTLKNARKMCKEVECGLTVEESILQKEICDGSCEKNGCHMVRVERKGDVVYVYVPEYF